MRTLEVTCLVTIGLLGGYALRPLLDVEFPRFARSRFALPDVAWSTPQSDTALAPGVESFLPPEPAAAGAARAGGLAQATLLEGDPVPLKLIGTVSGASPRDSAALIRDIDRKTAVRRVGDRIAGGSVRIEEIGPDGVVLTSEGARTRLEVDRGRSATPKGVESTFDSMSAEELFAMSDGEFEDQTARQDRRMMVNLEQALEVLRATGQFSVDPTIPGLLVSGFLPESPLGRLGLSPGDRILSIDGVEPRSRREGLRILAETLFSQGGNTILEVQRSDGSEIEIARAAGALLDPPAPPAGGETPVPDDGL